jgi:type I restriction-modification system DNA methylase subunit/restriction endonuclease S subunit
MPNYSCKKCGKDFYQKNDYTKHMNRKLPCDGTNINEKVNTLEEKIKNLEQKTWTPEYAKIENLVDANIPIDTEEMSESKADESKETLMSLWESKKQNMNTATLKKVADILECEYLSKIKKADIIAIISTELSEKNEDDWPTDKIRQKLIKLFNIKSGSRSRANNIDASVRVPKKKTLKQEQPTDEEKIPVVAKTICEKIIKNPIHGLVDIMHNIMRDSESITGKKAYNDMIKLLCLRFIEPYLNGGLKYVIDHDYNINGENLNQYKYLLYFSALHDEVKSKGHDVLEDTLYKIYDMLSHHTNFECIFKKKKTFNCSKGITLRKCIEEINKELDGYDFKNSKSDIIGEIHEYFVNNYSKSNDTEFGQFFTPRTLINLTNKLYKELFPDHHPKSFYEPCMGTGGFIMGMYEGLSDEERKTVSGSSFHGIEREPDSYASGMLNLLLTFNPADADTEIPLIECKSSLINNSTKTYDRINTNPPFAVSIDYKELIGSSPDLKIIKSDKSDRVSMKKMYPIENNKADGFVCFLQHCMFKLSDNGVCSIVLPDGRFFTKDGKLQKMRKYLLENCVLKAVLNVPSGVFEHTGTSTAVLFFTKIQGAKTENVEFYMTQVDNDNKCIGYEKLGDASIDEIKKNDYVLSWATYKPEILPEYKDVEWKTIGEIYSMLPSTKHCTNMGLDIGEYRFYNSSQNGKKLYLKNYEVNKLSLIIGNGGTANIHIDIKFTPSKHVTVLQSTCPDINNYHVYYYLLNNLHVMEQFFSGAGCNWMNRQQLSKIKIPIPSIEKQNAIVEQCDLITELKNNAETSITTLESLAKTYHDDNICKMHHDGTEWKPIGEICDLNPKNSMYKYSWINYIDISSVKNGVLNEIKTHTEKFPSRAQRIPKLNDILYSSVRPNLKGYLYYNKLIDNCIVSTGFILIRNKNLLIESKFIYYVLTSDTYNKKISDKAGGSSYPSITSTALEKFKIPIPSIEKQNEMIEYYDFLHNAINEQKKIIKNYELMIKNAISL